MHNSCIGHMDVGRLAAALGTVQHVALRQPPVGQINKTAFSVQSTYDRYARICWRVIMWLSVICRRALEYESICANRTSHDHKGLSISMALFLIYWASYSSSRGLSV